MNICSCGNLFADQYSQCPRCDALQVFGLGKDATETEIRNAYRILVKVWQPDRLQDDPELKEEAENKLKDINTAFESLIATSTELIERQRSVYTTSRAASTETIPDAVAAPRKASLGYTTLVVLPNRTPPPLPGLWQKTKPLFAFWRRFRLIFGIAALAFLILTGRSIWTVFKAHDAARQAAQPAPQAAQPAPQNAESSQAEKTRAAYRLTLPPPRNLDSRQPEKTGAATQKAPAAPHHVLLPYLTVGSTRDEALTQEGTPTASSEDKLVYGKSELYLKDGAVVGWRIDPSSPIRVKLWPGSPVDPGLSFFSYGSSKDSVLLVQGTPTAFTEDKFEYGGSVVYFRNNRVYSWRNDPASIPLRAR